MLINALPRLGGVDANDLPKDMQAMGIAGGAASLFASHPSLEERIAALQQQ
jgi:heat shock protein HtpX